MAQSHLQKYNQHQHWPAVGVKNMVFICVRPVSSRVTVRSNWLKQLTAFRPLTDNGHREKMEAQCRNSWTSQLSEFKHVLVCITLQYAFLLCWISMAQLPACHPQSERLLSQNWVFRLARVWNSFTSHLVQDFILNQWPFSSDGKTYGIWLPAAYTAENFALKKEILAEIDVRLIESDVSTVSSLE